MEPAEYDDVAEALYNRAADLQNKLEESRGGHECPLGADFAAYFAPANAVCRPVLIRGKRINLRELNQAKVHFRDRRITIRTERCNRAGNLGRALSTA